ncbi:hypothetical protein CapIbe_004057 [Capra ibex]
MLLVSSHRQSLLPLRPSSWSVTLAGDQVPKMSGSPGCGDGEGGAILGFPVCSSSKFELTTRSHLDSQPALLLDRDGNLCSRLCDFCLRPRPKSVLSPFYGISSSGIALPARPERLCSPKVAWPHAAR